MGREPCVDAGDVKGVATLGQQPQIIVLSELGEANGAVGAVNQALPSPVLAHGDGSYDGLLQPHRVDIPNEVRSRNAVAVGLGVTLLEAVLSNGRSGAPPSVAELDDDGVVANQEEAGGEHGYEDDDNGGDGRAMVCSKRRGRRRGRRRGLGEGDTWEFEKMTAGILGDVLLLWKEEVVKKSNGHG